MPLPMLLLLLLGSLIMHHTRTQLFCLIFTVSPNTRLFLCREPVKGIHKHCPRVTSCLRLNLIQLVPVRARCWLSLGDPLPRNRRALSPFDKVSVTVNGGPCPVARLTKANS